MPRLTIDIHDELLPIFLKMIAGFADDIQIVEQNHQQEQEIIEPNQEPQQQKTYFDLNVIEYQGELFVSRDEIDYLPFSYVFDEWISDYVTSRNEYGQILIYLHDWEIFAKNHLTRYNL